MDEPLKRRLIGATVLVSLAVIFVPMLLEREPMIDSGLNQSNIPPRPQPMNTADLLPPERPRPLHPDDAPIATVNPTPAPAIEPAPTPAPAPTTTVTDTTPVEPVKPAEPPTVSGKSTPQEPAAKARPGEKISAWVIQVGSFSKRENAERLVAELRRKKYPAFTEQASVDGSAVYRVRVGPEVSRRLAEEMLASVNAVLKGKNMKGSLQEYP